MKKLLVTFLLLVIIAGVYCAWMIFGPAVHSPESKFFYVHTGSTYQEVKNDLMKQGIIRSDFWFDKISKYAGYDQKVRAGKYEISNNSSIKDLVKMLRAGRQAPVNLVITKLRTAEDLAKKIDFKFEPDSSNVKRFLTNNDSLLQFDVDTNTLMTLVIPNTYRYTWNTPVENVLQKLYNEEKKFWNDDRLQKARNFSLSAKEIYILASIVEEETNKQQDKGKVASVYFNRLRKGMRLAADPTIKFAMKNFGLKRIYHKYLSYESPYNTYLNSGLPPGPICTPSIKTIDAVLDMPQTNYLFFVARSDFSGYSDFAETYREHLIYAKAYQRALDSVILSRQSNK